MRSIQDVALLKLGQKLDPKDRVAIVPAGMMGDRADVIFASPDEISGFITRQC